MKEINYQQQVNMENEIKLRELCTILPKFCGEFFRGIRPTTASRTRIAYAYDLTVFFEYLCTTNKMLKGKPTSELHVSLLDQIKAVDIEEYLDYLRCYKKDGKIHANDECGIKRKLVVLRTLYHYFYRREQITTNPASLVATPRMHQKEIIRLEPDEVSLLLDAVESGENLTKTQQIYHEKTKKRDLALLTLLLGTGIRVSECVGLDQSDVDFSNGGIRITRKGGDQTIVYFGDEVCQALNDYMEQRKHMIAVQSDENALFLSMQKKRMSVKSIENLVKKYAQTVTKLKKITPHKLRSTYGTNLYRETGDIYLVADVLGHKDVNTTKKHYAAIEDSRRKSAANIVKLREP